MLETLRYTLSECSISMREETVMGRARISHLLSAQEKHDLRVAKAAAQKARNKAKYEAGKIARQNAYYLARKEAEDRKMQDETL